MALISCSSQLPRIADWDRQQQHLEQLQDWELQGKVGIKMPQHNGSAYINWQQQPDNYAIRLYGPLGQGTTWIRSLTNGVELMQAGRPTLQAASPEALMQESLGWWLPISDLRYWVRGIPAPDTPITAQRKNEQGTLSELQQDGWRLTYSRYNAVDNWQLPSKITAERDDIKLTLIVKDWQLTP